MVPLTAHPACSVIIRCFNEEAHIGRLLGSLEQQIVRDVEGIVVDSGSTDSTLAIAGRYPVRILRLAPEQFSFGRALNVGLRAARAPLAVLASAHVYPTGADWLERLLAPFADPQVALVYGRQRGNTTTKFSEHQIFARQFPDDARRQQTPPFCNNANAAIRRALWERLPYDEELTGLEDIDWAARAIALGHRMVYAPEAEVIHVHDESPQRIFRRYFREALAWRHIFPGSRFPLKDFFRATIQNVWSDLGGARREGALLRQALSIVIFRTMQYWGTYHGMRGRTVTAAVRRTLYYYPAAREAKQQVHEVAEDAGRDP